MPPGTEAEWFPYVAERFPAYLLPQSASTQLSVEEAARFMERLAGGPEALALIRAASFLAPRALTLRTFVTERLEDVATQLPSWTKTTRREWEGGYHGRLHIQDTLARRVHGRPASFVTLAHERDFDLPENVLLRAVCERFLALIVLLREHQVLRDDVGWGEPLRGCEGRLRRVLASTALREVPLRESTEYDAMAARNARHTAFHDAARLSEELRHELDDATPSRVAALLAAGALLPLSDETRFELAVVIRLMERLHTALNILASERWRIERALIMRGRKEVAVFQRDDGVLMRVFYNVAWLPPGPADLGARHYLSSTGRLRPDVTITVEHSGVINSAVVVECKHSDDPRTLAEGFREALLYRFEYARHLTSPIKAVLVASGAIPGELRTDDEVVAVSWSNWPPEALIEQLVTECR